ncbi:hypothetical protein K504DRAFT_535041 [Pleomassaria siparia CBS 279.74]|uniref:Rhodopsin domain-containing protein n=1 Tax=Pleomassaria siparia CBS 279.74 TaxID=1314801 RepID=A0A6G1K7K1_9PLEO|nr:hypothetical protein K504DRAFT_535041 [Pleomassaria siparia CBS 279.74]
MSAEQQEWPNRGLEIILSTTIVCVLSTLLLIWRIVYGLMQKRRLLLCDYLLVVATMMNVTTTILRFKTTDHGMGRHFNDPSLTFPNDILIYSYYLYINQVINLIAMTVLKLSICAYLLALNFSTIYIVVVWASILMVTVFNFLLPIMSIFGCRPFEANWNRALKGKCWFQSGPGLTYMQGVSNCVTDAVYVIAPLIYLRTIQLPSRTQWGLRVVFLLSIMATVCSIFKTYELSSLAKTNDPTWDGVDLTIWSATELSVGILVASLPPMRKQFDKLFRYILPTTMQSKSETPGKSIPLYNSSKHQSIYQSKHNFSRPMGLSEDNDDGSSERHMLPEGEPVQGKIVKTVVHEITSIECESPVNGPVRHYENYDPVPR